MENEEGTKSCWSGLHGDVLERIGRGLALPDLLSARLTCNQWRRHVGAAVTRLPHPHLHPRHRAAPSVKPLALSPPPAAGWQLPLATAIPELQPSARQNGLDNLLDVQHQGSDEKGLAAEAEADLEDTQFYHLVELDAQPAGHEGDVAWRRSLEALAACLPRLSEVMVYVSSRVSAAALGQQLRSLPAALPGLTKLELRFILPSSAPCLGAPLAQLQPDLSTLTGLQTLYLIQGASPEPALLSSVLPALSRLADLKLLSGLPQYGLTNDKLEALAGAAAAGSGGGSGGGTDTGAAAGGVACLHLGSLARLHVEVSGVGQVDVGVAALSRLRGLRQLWLDGVVTLGPAVTAALRELPALQELRLELDSPTHLPDLFTLPALTSLLISYHGDELDEADDDDDDELPQPPPPQPPAVAAVAAAPAAVPGPGLAGPGGAAPGVGAAAAAALPQDDGQMANGVGDGHGGGGGGGDWEALERLVRGHAARPILRELSLQCCGFASDPLPKLAALVGLTSLALYDCRWPPPPRAAAGAAAAEAHGVVSAPPAPWAALSTLKGLTSFCLAQCVCPPITGRELRCLAVAWPGLTSLQLQSGLTSAQGHGAAAALAAAAAVAEAGQQQEAAAISGAEAEKDAPLQAAMAAAQAAAAAAAAPFAPATFDAVVARWRRLESLTLNGSWCNDPRVSLDVGLLPPSLTSLVMTSLTLVGSAAAREALAAAVHAAAGGRGGDSVAGGTAHTSSAVLCSSTAGLEATYATVRTAGGHAPPPPLLPALEHLVLAEVRLAPGLGLGWIAAQAPGLRSLEVTNLLPNLCDASCAALAALTALTVLRVSQDQEPQEEEWEGQAAAPKGKGDAAPDPAAGGQSADSQQPASSSSRAAAADPPPFAAPATPHGPFPARSSASRAGRLLTGMGLAALTPLKQLRQLEWLPWGCEPLGLAHVRALAALRRLHLVTLRGARDGAISGEALEALRGALPLCDLDDTEWSGLVDV